MADPCTPKRSTTRPQRPSASHCRAWQGATHHRLQQQAQRRPNRSECLRGEGPAGNSTDAQVPGSGASSKEAQHGQEPLLLLVRDVSKAFRRIGVRTSQIASLHFRWKGVSYFDTRLPFGHAASAHYCCKLTAAIASALTKKLAGYAIVLAYVDDFILIAKPEVATYVQEVFDQCLKDIGLPISQSKASESGEWSTLATWIGFEHDTHAMTHALPQAKKEAIRDQLTTLRWLHQKGVSLHGMEVKSMCGKLSHIATVFTAGRAFLTHLMKTHTEKHTYSVRLSEEAAAELDWWIAAIEVMPTVATMRKAPCEWSDPAIISDASLTGHGALLFANQRAALMSDTTAIVEAMR